MTTSSYLRMNSGSSTTSISPNSYYICWVILHSISVPFIVIFFFSYCFPCKQSIYMYVCMYVCISILFHLLWFLFLLLFSNLFVIYLSIDISLSFLQSVYIKRGALFFRSDIKTATNLQTSEYCFSFVFFWFISYILSLAFCIDTLVWKFSDMLEKARASLKMSWTFMVYETMYFNNLIKLLSY